MRARLHALYFYVSVSLSSFGPADCFVLYLEVAYGLLAKSTWSIVCGAHGHYQQAFKHNDKKSSPNSILKNTILQLENKRQDLQHSTSKNSNKDGYK